MTTNNSNPNEVPASSAPYASNNQVRPPAYTSMPLPHMPPPSSAVHASSAPATEPPPASRYIPASQTATGQYGYMMPPQHSMGLAPPAQALPPIHGTMGGPTSGGFPRMQGFQTNGGGMPQYATGDGQGMPAMGGEGDRGKVSGPAALPATGPAPDGGLPGQSIMQMLGGVGFPKGPSAPGLEGNIMMPSQDQLLIQGPVVLNQLNSVAEYLAAKGDFANAIRYYERITGLDPENGAAWTALGHCYLLTDDLQKAFTSYQKALYSLPDVRDPQLWYGIGLLYDKVFCYR